MKLKVKIMMFNKKKALTANFFLVSVQMHLSTEELI